MKKKKNQIPTYIAMGSVGALLCFSIFKKSSDAILRHDVSTIPTEELREYIEFAKEDTTKIKEPALLVPCPKSNQTLLPPIYNKSYSGGLEETPDSVFLNKTMKAILN